MCKKIAVFLFCLGVGCAGAQTPPADGKISPLEPFKKTDCVLILAPHPDDETIACAGVIQQALAAGADVRVAYLTNGEHNELAFIVYEKRITLRQGEFIHMGEVRRQESIAAMKSLGLSEDRLIFLGYPDFGTFTIFREFWRTGRPFKDILTRISTVPYKEDFSYGAPYTGDSILADLKAILTRYRPNKIFVSHPADVNADHKTLYLFLQVALADLDTYLLQPKVYPYLVHCVGWPVPRRYHPELSLIPPEKFIDSQVAWQEYVLTPQELEKKHQAVLAYKSQTQSSAFYLLAFARKNELFGDCPQINFSATAAPAADQGPFLPVFSNMFTDSTIGVMGDFGNAIDEQGRVSYGVKDGAFLIRIQKNQEIHGRFSIACYLFGYSHHRPFAEMPKIRIITRHTRLKIFDGKKILPTDGVALELQRKELTIRVPLALLGNPDFVLASLKTYAGVLPVNAVSFRKITLTQ